jgi:hypothetical protein
LASLISPSLAYIYQDGEDSDDGDLSSDVTRASLLQFDGSRRDDRCKRHDTRHVERDNDDDAGDAGAAAAAEEAGAERSLRATEGSLFGAMGFRATEVVVGVIADKLWFSFFLAFFFFKGLASLSLHY